jgi:uracil-DNA glycosylase family 4
MEASLSVDPDRYQVALIGESLNETEAEEGGPFKGKAGFRLTRLIEWAGLDRSKFDIFNVAWCHPVEKIEGSPFEFPAISHCRAAHWGKLLSRSKVLVPMGKVANGAFLGRRGILQSRGYISEDRTGSGLYVLPTVHPSFIQQGMSKWSAAFIQDIQKSVELAAEGMPPSWTDYCLDPSPSVAYQWAQAYREALRVDKSLMLAFDIETPGKPEEEDELDTSDDLPDQTWNIWRIGFSYRGLAALSIPWEPPFFAAIRLLLESDGDKIVWNAGFDVPRVKRAGFNIGGTIHDGMVAWHILHSDLPKRLAFVSTFTCPWQPAWKHLSGAKPAFYNATDADVELRSMEVIKRELQRVGLWDVYVRDVIDLQPVLDHMSQRGMRVDGDIRNDRAGKLSVRLSEVRADLERLVPIEARRIEHVYVKTPKDTTGLLTRPGHRQIPVCPQCGSHAPTKPHFKVYAKKVNPCGGQTAVLRDVEVTEYYRLAEFKLSRNLLISYHQHLGRQLPLVWDRKEGRRKVSFNEEQMKKLILKYPTDSLYPTVLDFRALDKLAGTYVGRPIENQ